MSAATGIFFGAYACFWLGIMKPVFAVAEAIDAGTVTATFIANQIACVIAWEVFAFVSIFSGVVFSQFLLGASKAAKQITIRSKR